jgi:hypothetical protein
MTALGRRPAHFAQQMPAARSADAERCRRSDFMENGMGDRTMWSIVHFLVFIALVVLSLTTPYFGPMLGLANTAIGGFTGALISGAATMLGALLIQLSNKSESKKRVLSMKSLISAELVNVSTGYINLQQQMTAAIHSYVPNMKPRENPDFSNEMPRSMPFTSNHGTDILKLLPSELDVLSTLQSNMEVTRRNLQELSMGKQIFSRFAIKRISGRIVHDMEILAQGFEKFAPYRQFKVQDAPPELATVLLRRLAKQLGDTVKSQLDDWTEPQPETPRTT